MTIVSEFFLRYERAFNEFDVDRILQAYADCSIAATPLGSLCAKNDKNLRAALQQAYDFYKDLYRRNAIRSTKIVSFTENPLNDYYSMVTIKWGLFREDGSEVYTFEVLYLVSTIGESPKIILFIAPDEQRLLRERGLI